MKKSGLFKLEPSVPIMAQRMHENSFFVKSFSFMVMAFMILPGCKKNEHFIRNDFEQVNLVSDIAGFGAKRLDPQLVNAWGIAVAPSGPIWISANNAGVSPVYDKNGTMLRPAVIIPSPGGTSGGTPTGVVFNSTTDFAITLGKTQQASRFIFATEDGTIAAWGGGNSAIIVADQSTFNAVYKGIAIANDGVANYIFATNFKQNRIDVFDKNYNLVSWKVLKDKTIPDGFAPFNIRNLNGWLYVTYARQKGPDNHDDQAGEGNGYVDIFKPDGTLIKRFASRGKLNSPWGIARASSIFSDAENAILIGNFGDGRINVFSDDGRFIQQLKDEKGPVTIDGLWALETNVPTADPTQLFFTAGPVKETHGLFGYLQIEK